MNMVLIYYLKDEPYVEVLLHVVNKPWSGDYKCDNRIWDCDVHEANTHLFHWAFDTDFISVVTEGYYIDCKQKDFVHIRKNAYYGPHQQLEIRPLAVLANAM